MVKAHRRRGIFQWTKGVLLVWLIVFDLTALTRAEQRRQLLAQSDSTLSRLDFLEGGSCGPETCRREAVSASAQVAGVPVQGNGSCSAVDRAMTDNVGADGEKATIEVVHVCEDAQGVTTLQGEGDCVYTICTGFSWGVNGTLHYEVFVEHSAGTGGARSVTLDVYVNFEDEGTPRNVGDGLQCEETSCSGSTSCEGDAVDVEVLAYDTLGYGWPGTVRNTSSYWTLTAEDIDSFSGENFTSRAGSWSGTVLEDNVYVKRKLCLEPGGYSFVSPDSTAWPQEVAWDICSRTGHSAKVVHLTVNSGTCSTSANALVSTDDMACEMPEENSCTALTAQLDNSEDLGIYFDSSCNTSAPGCSVAGVVDGADGMCRFCLLDRESWAENNPDEAGEDWPDCPCCVLESVGMNCDDSASPTESKDSDLLWNLLEAALAVLGIAVAIGLGICVLLCCLKRKTAKQKSSRSRKLKHSASSIDEDAEADLEGGVDKHPFATMARPVSMMGTRAVPRGRPPAAKSSRPHSASMAVGSGAVGKMGDDSFTRHALVKQQSSLDDGESEADFEGVQDTETYAQVAKRRVSGSNPMFDPRRQRAAGVDARASCGDDSGVFGERLKDVGNGDMMLVVMETVEHREKGVAEDKLEMSVHSRASSRSRSSEVPEAKRSSRVDGADAEAVAAESSTDYRESSSRSSDVDSMEEYDSPDVSSSTPRTPGRVGDDGDARVSTPSNTQPTSSPSPGSSSSRSGSSSSRSGSSSSRSGSSSSDSGFDQPLTLRVMREISVSIADVSPVGAGFTDNSDLETRMPGSPSTFGGEPLDSAEDKEGLVSSDGPEMPAPSPPEGEESQRETTPTMSLSSSSSRRGQRPPSLLPSKDRTASSTAGSERDEGSKEIVGAGADEAGVSTGAGLAGKAAQSNPNTRPEGRPSGSGYPGSRRGTLGGRLLRSLSSGSIRFVIGRESHQMQRMQVGPKVTSGGDNDQDRKVHNESGSAIGRPTVDLSEDGDPGQSNSVQHGAPDASKSLAAAGSGPILADSAGAGNQSGDSEDESVRASGPLANGWALSNSSTSSIKIPRVEATGKERPSLRVSDALAGKVDNCGRMRRSSSMKKSAAGATLDLRSSGSSNSVTLVASSPGAFAGDGDATNNARVDDPEGSKPRRSSGSRGYGVGASRATTEGDVGGDVATTSTLTRAASDFRGFDSAAASVIEDPAVRREKSPGNADWRQDPILRTLHASTFREVERRKSKRGESGHGASRSRSRSRSKSRSRSRSRSQSRSQSPSRRSRHHSHGTRAQHKREGPSVTKKSPTRKLRDALRRSRSGNERHELVYTGGSVPRVPVVVVTSRKEREAAKSARETTAATVSLSSSVKKSGRSDAPRSIRSDRTHGSASKSSSGGGTGGSSQHSGSTSTASSRFSVTTRVADKEMGPVDDLQWIRDRLSESSKLSDGDAHNSDDVAGRDMSISDSSNTVANGDHSNYSPTEYIPDRSFSRRSSHLSQSSKSHRARSLSQSRSPSHRLHGDGRGRRSEAHVFETPGRRRDSNGPGGSMPRDTTPHRGSHSEMSDEVPPRENPDGGYVRHTPGSAYRSRKLDGVQNRSERTPDQGYLSGTSDRISRSETPDRRYPHSTPERDRMEETSEWEYLEGTPGRASFDETPDRVRTGRRSDRGYGRGSPEGISHEETPDRVRAGGTPDRGYLRGTPERGASRTTPDRGRSRGLSTPSGHHRMGRSRSRSRDRIIRSISRGSSSRFSMSSLQRVDECSDENSSRSPTHPSEKAESVISSDTVSMQPESSRAASDDAMPFVPLAEVDGFLEGSESSRVVDDESTDYASTVSRKSAVVPDSAEMLSSPASRLRPTLEPGEGMRRWGVSAGSTGTRSIASTPGKSARGSRGQVDANGTPTNWLEHAKIRRQLVLSAAQAQEDKKAAAAAGKETMAPSPARRIPPSRSSSPAPSSKPSPIRKNGHARSSASSDSAGSVRNGSDGSVRASSELTSRWGSDSGSGADGGLPSGDGGGFHVENGTKERTLHRGSSKEHSAFFDAAYLNDHSKGVASGTEDRPHILDIGEHRGRRRDGRGRAELSPGMGKENPAGDFHGLDNARRQAIGEPSGERSMEHSVEIAVDGSCSSVSSPRSMKSWKKVELRSASAPAPPVSNRKLSDGLGFRDFNLSLGPGIKPGLKALSVASSSSSRRRARSPRDSASDGGLMYGPGAKLSRSSFNASVSSSRAGLSKSRLLTKKSSNGGSALAPSAWGVYGFTAAGDDDRSRGSVDDPKVVETSAVRAFSTKKSWSALSASSKGMKSLASGESTVQEPTGASYQEALERGAFSQGNGEFDNVADGDLEVLHERLPDPSVDDSAPEGMSAAGEDEVQGSAEVMSDCPSGMRRFQRPIEA